MNNKKKIIFGGSTNFSFLHLSKLISESKDNIVGVITTQDFLIRKKTKFNSIKKISLKNNIPVLQPLKMDISLIKEFLSNLQVDIMIIVDLGIIFPKEILKIPKLGSINIHCSLLPKWRGASPVQTSILNGDKRTGVTIIEMNEGLDTGDIIYQKSCVISLNETSGTLYKKLEKISILGMKKTIKKLKNNTIKKKPQNSKKATFSKKFKKIDSRLKWNFSAMKLHRIVRAFNPKPISYCYFKNQLLKIWKTEIIFPIKKIKNKKIGEIISTSKLGIQVFTKKGILNIIEIQIPGKKAISSKDILNSKKNWFTPGNILS